MEQLGAEVLLECGDLAAQGGLCEVELLGGAREVSELSHLDKAAQLLQVHIDSISASPRAVICIGVIRAACLPLMYERTPNIHLRPRYRYRRVGPPCRDRTLRSGDGR